MKKLMKRIALCLCALALTGCSMFHRTDDAAAAATPACPATGLVKGAAFFPVISGDAPHQAAADLAASAALRNMTGDCKYEKGEIVLNLTLNFVGRKGPKGPGLGSQSFPYFVAVLSPDDQILQRQVFSTTVDFDNTTGAGVSSEDHKISVPLKNMSQGPSYKIAAGFTLTSQQAKYNKENNAD